MQKVVEIMTTKFGHSKQSKTVFSVDQIDAYSPTLIPTVSVVIPALNEARNLPSVFSALPRNLHQVILVDGGSTDDTVKIALELRKDVCIVQQTYRGKGNALACGFAEKVICVPYQMAFVLLRPSCESYARLFRLRRIWTN